MVAVFLITIWQNSTVCVLVICVWDQVSWYSCVWSLLIFLFDRVQPVSVLYCYVCFWFSCVFSHSPFSLLSVFQCVTHTCSLLVITQVPPLSVYLCSVYSVSVSPLTSLALLILCVVWAFFVFWMIPWVSCKFSFLLP